MRITDAQTPAEWLEAAHQDLEELTQRRLEIACKVPWHRTESEAKEIETIVRQLSELWHWGVGR